MIESEKRSRTVKNLFVAGGECCAGNGTSGAHFPDDLPNAIQFRCQVRIEMGAGENQIVNLRKIANRAIEVIIVGTSPGQPNEDAQISGVQGVCL